MSASTPNIAPDRIAVAAGILTDGYGRVLVAQRTRADRYFAQWEFPGGKLERHETVEQALQRELEEELGIRVGRTEPLLTVQHDYVDRQVTLHVLRVTSYCGEPRGCEGQALQWLSPGDLDKIALLEGNRPIVRILQLPERYLITGADRFGEDRILRMLDSIPGHRGLIQVRERSLTRAAYRDFVQEVLHRCRRRGAKVLLNADIETVQALGADGVHLAAVRLRDHDHRPLPEPYWVAASCHDEAEIRRAEAIQVDFVVLGPVSRTESHPGSAPIGWERFRELSRLTQLPVYAIGGMRDRDLPRAQLAGARGIAMISGAWE